MVAPPAPDASQASSSSRIFSLHSHNNRLRNRLITIARVSGVTTKGGILGQISKRALNL